MASDLGRDIVKGRSRRENRHVPLYHQVEQVIRHRISSGLYAPGSQIPSEHQLGRELEVSRVTVREALRELVQDNLLVKVQGKGTFVSLNPPTNLPPIKYTGSIEEVYERVLKLEVKYVHVSRVPVPEKVRALLSLGAEHQELVRIERRRHDGGEPFSFTVNYLPSSIGDRIDPEQLHTVPLLLLLERDLKIPIIRAEETVEAAPADPVVAAQLGIPVLYPVMHITRLMFTTDDQPFEVVETSYRADKFQYRVHMVRIHRDGKWTWTQGAGETAR